jgi:hypothetical protein
MIVPSSSSTEARLFLSFDFTFDLYPLLAMMICALLGLLKRLDVCGGGERDGGDEYRAYTSQFTSSSSPFIPIKGSSDTPPYRSLHVGGGERRLKLPDDRKVSTGRTLRRRGAEFI